MHVHSEHLAAPYLEVSLIYLEGPSLCWLVAQPWHPSGTGGSPGPLGLQCLVEGNWGGSSSSSSLWGLSHFLGGKKSIINPFIANTLADTLIQINSKCLHNAHPSIRLMQATVQEYVQVITAQREDKHFKPHCIPFLLVTASYSLLLISIKFLSQPGLLKVMKWRDSLLFQRAETLLDCKQERNQLTQLWWQFGDRIPF